MGIYGRYILPPLLNQAMRQKDIMSRRAEVVPQARGRVLEIGIGPGLNLPFYGPEVSHVEGIDPSPELLRQARGRAGTVSFPVELREGSAESLPVLDRSIDTAVMTWTLCSITVPDKALGELRRVLKPSGRLLFAEHGLSPEPRVAAWQHRLEPLWRRVAGGCRLSHKIDDLIRAAGFEITRLTTGYMPIPRHIAWSAFIYQGEARVGGAGEPPRPSG
jgi:ubiquinone/menaquinone biosynthesis C-methylase UbiE